MNKKKSHTRERYKKEDQRHFRLCPPHRKNRREDEYEDKCGDHGFSYQVSAMSRKIETACSRRYPSRENRWHRTIKGRRERPEKLDLADRRLAVCADRVDRRIKQD
jgi:hypothetical protein